MFGVRSLESKGSPKWYTSSAQGTQVSSVGVSWLHVKTANRQHVNL